MRHKKQLVLLMDALTLTTDLVRLRERPELGLGVVALRFLGKRGEFRGLALSWGSFLVCLGFGDTVKVKIRYTE